MKSRVITSRPGVIIKPGFKVINYFDNEIVFKVSDSLVNSYSVWIFQVNFVKLFSLHTE